MTWFFLTILSELCATVETLTEKALMIKKGNNITPLIAAFYRNLFFYIFILAAAVFSIFGTTIFFLTPLIILSGVLHILNSLSYDYFLRNSEMTRISALKFTFPFFFLIFDALIFHQSFSLLQYLGIIFLVFGGVVISFNFSKTKIQYIFSWHVWGFLFLSLIAMGTHYGVFKYYNIQEGLNEISYYLNTWIVVLFTFLVVITFKKKGKETLNTLSHKPFIRRTFFAKFFDFLSGIFFLQAIALSSITEVNALASTSPLIFFLITYIVSLFGIDLQEDFSREPLIQKLISITLLIGGAILLVLF